MKDDASLSEVHQSIDTSNKTSKWRKLFAFFGPAYLVSVGYMDPGNWATGIAGGSRYGYALLWVLLMSNIIAIFLQSLSARLGVVRRKDLAQCNREAYPRGTNFVLYLLAEIAIAATDLAEILGMAIGLQLLFDIPLLWGVIIGFFDTLLLLWLQKLGMRKTEVFILGIIALISGCFLVEIFLAKPDVAEIATGFIPSLPDATALYIAIGIIGATVMPHNLYLHSALVQTRKIKDNPESIRAAIKYNFWDSAIALNLALLVNAAILILAATVFFKSGNTQIAELEDAHRMLEPLLGTKWASILFAVALIAAGQSSTVTGTLSGQIVMEGYLRLRISPVLRRLITRMLAIIPAVIVILISGEGKVGQLLIFSQVILSMQLAFAIIPLIHFVSNKKKMGQFALKTKAKIAAWLIAALIVILNFKLVYDEITDWISGTDSWWLIGIILLGAAGLIWLLFETLLYPLTERGKEISTDLHDPIDKLPDLPAPDFKTIALALDFSPFDSKIFQYGLKFADKNTKFILIHITESAPPQLMDEVADDYETRKDRKKLEQYIQMLNDKGFEAEAITGFRNRNSEIARIVKESNSNLLILGSHGHRGFKDFIFGETVNRVRHLVKIPVFVAQ
ncbi:MAG: Nramp family divalent metal transporter [Flavobacteriia bacterium]|nr:Nramp family divalent metal transporter [Flavobacteriia bacterium]